MSNALDDLTRARLLAVSTNLECGFISPLPLPNLQLRFEMVDNTTIRIAVGLYLGSPL